MNNSVYVLSRSETETDALGVRVAAVLSGGITIALNGQLGSGKTRFIRALCQGLGVHPDQVNSPTFVLVQQYVDGRLPVVHMDTWRLADVDEFLAIGAEEYLYSTEWVTLIEWADRVSEILPADHLQICIHQAAESERGFTLTATGPRSLEILQAFSQTA